MTLGLLWQGMSIFLISKFFIFMLLINAILGVIKLAESKVVRLFTHVLSTVTKLGSG